MTEKDFSKFTGYDAFGQSVVAGDYVSAPFGDNSDATLFVVDRILPNWKGKYGSGGGILLSIHNRESKYLSEWQRRNTKFTTVRVYKQVVKLLPSQVMPYLLSK